MEELQPSQKYILEAHQKISSWNKFTFKTITKWIANRNSWKRESPFTHLPNYQTYYHKAPWSQKTLQNYHKWITTGQPFKPQHPITPTRSLTSLTYLKLSLIIARSLHQLIQLQQRSHSERIPSKHLRFLVSQTRKRWQILL